MSIAIVVPTTGEHSGALENLVQASGLQPKDFIFVRTRDDGLVPAGATCIDDFGPVNIQRWWNRGLDAAESTGSKYVVFANDDVTISGQTIPDLVSAVEASGASIASPGAKDKLFRARFPFKWQLDGALWLMVIEHGFRLDENFVWWMGDRDIEERVRRWGYGIITVRTEYWHEPGHQTSGRHDLQRLALVDKQTFSQKYPFVSRGEGFRAKWPAYASWARRRFCS